MPAGWEAAGFGVFIRASLGYCWSFSQGGGFFLALPFRLTLLGFCAAAKSSPTKQSYFLQISFKQTVLLELHPPYEIR